jgi:predicted RNase H-like nuclease (RuvC/YqgF family)
MNSVQENKNELEAAVRYCESAISRAQATIESMEFRQQAASKAWHEQTGREAALEREVSELKTQLVEERDRSMGYTKEIEELRDIIDRMGDDSTGDSVTIKQLRDELDELSKAYKDSTHEEVTMKKAWREQRELVALKDDQIAMLERRLAKYTGEKSYPFKEGDIYYVFNQLDGTWIESVWDDESERIHDSPTIPSHPHRVYFTIDQKNVLDKFKPEEL